MKNVLQKSFCEHVLVAFHVELTHRWGKAGCDLCDKRTPAVGVALALTEAMTVDLCLLLCYVTFCKRAAAN